MRKFKNLKTFSNATKWLEKNEKINAIKSVIESRNFEGNDEDYFIHLVHLLLENARNKAVRAAVHKYFYKYFAHQTYDILNRQLWLVLDYYQEQEQESETFYEKEITFRLRTVLDDNIVEFWNDILN